MKIIKKLFNIIIVILILYIILIFLKPNIAGSIAKLLNIEPFNEKIRIIKKGLDIFSTKIPNEKEMKDIYNTTKNKIGKVKETINDIREKSKDIEKKYEETKEFIQKTSQTIDELSKDYEKIKDIGNLTNSGETK